MVFCWFFLFYFFLHSFCFKVWSVWQTWDQLTHTGDSDNTHNGSVGQRYTQVTHYLLVLSDQQISIIRYPPIKGWQGFIFAIFSGHFIISVSSDWHRYQHCGPTTSPVGLPGNDLISGCFVRKRKPKCPWYCFKIGHLLILADGWCITTYSSG